MSLTATLLVLSLLLPLCCRIRSCRHSSPSGMHLTLYRRGAWALGGIVLLSMAAQEAILFLSGQLKWATALPLHLCSLMGLCTLPALLTRQETLLHALLLLGAPGAALALIFPAVTDTPWPRLTCFFFSLMHAGILFAPLLPLSLGWRPRPQGAVQAGLFLLTTGLAALLVNRLTGGNYLFLAGPVSGTPLEWLAGRGVLLYRLGLLTLASLVLASEGIVLLFVCRHTRMNTDENCETSA